MIIDTDRLMLRQMSYEDKEEISHILQDRDTMYAYEHAFSDREVYEWIEKNINRYKDDGYGLWAVILKESGYLIGQCGLTVQDVNGKKVVEIGYLLNRNYCGKGYATEAARACKKYAFEVLGLDEVYSIIRDNNFASQRVAERNGMTVKGTIIKHYMGYIMPHIIYSVSRQEYEKEK